MPISWRVKLVYRNTKYIMIRPSTSAPWVMYSREKGRLSARQAA